MSAREWRVKIDLLVPPGHRGQWQPYGGGGGTAEEVLDLAAGMLDNPNYGVTFQSREPGDWEIDDPRNLQHAAPDPKAGVPEPPVPLSTDG